MLSNGKQVHALCNDRSYRKLRETVMTYVWTTIQTIKNKEGFSSGNFIYPLSPNPTTSQLFIEKKRVQTYRKVAKIIQLMHSYSLLKFTNCCHSAIVAFSLLSPIPALPPSLYIYMEVTDIMIHHS